MSVVTITSLIYNSDTNKIRLTADFSTLGETSATGGPMPGAIDLSPEAIGNRIAKCGYTDGDAALTAIVLEHAARVAPTATGVTVDWQSPSDEERAQQLDAHADRIEAARIFFSA